MRIREIMSTDVETIASTEPAKVARQRMMEQNVHHLVVVEHGAVVGVVSSRDLKGVDAEAPVGDAMSGPAVTVDSHATVRQAANLLRGRGIGCLPVVDGHKLLGIVTISDLLTLIGKGLEKPVQMNKRWTLKHRGPRAIQSRRAGR